jgi:hypothetical protein
VIASCHEFEFQLEFYSQTCMLYEEEDTCMAYEEDTCEEFQLEFYSRDGTTRHNEEVPVGLFRHQ